MTLLATSSTAMRLLMLGLMVALVAMPAFGSAVITNGKGIYLGVLDSANLGYTDGVTASNNGAGGRVGVAANGTVLPALGAGIWDATAPGCVCEGWGVAVNGAVSGYANVDTDGGANGLSNVSFVNTASTATVVNGITGLAGLTVTHEYKPSSSDNLYEAVVTITNGSAGSVSDVRYRRVMDWDVPNTEFNEYVSIGGWPASALLHSTDDGFDTANPLVASGARGCVTDGNFADCGIDDHGALFDFGFGSLGAGESKTFSIFYGAAENKKLAFSALSAVGAEVYSLGVASSGRYTLGEPATYIFAFKGVGGTVISDVPEPGTYAMMLSGLGLLFLARRRKA